MIKHLFYLALLLPEPVRAEAIQIQQHFKDFYDSSAAFKSPPHITLVSPFEWFLEDLPDLVQNLKDFAQVQDIISITLDGFGCFSPHVIYINAVKTQELLTLQKKLTTNLELTLDIAVPLAKQRPFAPHVTVAYKDLTKDNFYQAWSEFVDKKFFYQFNISRLTLLIHRQKRWHIEQEFNLDSE